MDVDEDDDFYGAEDGAQTTEEQPTHEDAPEANVKPEQEDEDLEEGEEEDEAGSDDSDIEIITKAKDGAKPAPPPKQSKYNAIPSTGKSTSAKDATAKPPAVKKETPAKETPSISGADLPGLSTSKIDVNAKPIYQPAGKPITQVNIDEDLIENEKPWRRPGTDITDYFNYGFDEFTWALYASKQETLRSDYNQDKVAQNQKKMFEDMNMMMTMGMMPGAGGAAMPGMEGVPPEMQAMMQQMMASGIDPSQMDPSMFAGMQGNQAGAGSNQGGFGQGQGQGQGFGYDQGMEGRNRGGNFGRGRGGHRNKW